MIEMGMWELFLRKRKIIVQEYVSMYVYQIAKLPKVRLLPFSVFSIQSWTKFP